MFDLLRLANNFLQLRGYDKQTQARLTRMHATDAIEGYTSIKYGLSGGGGATDEARKRSHKEPLFLA